MCRKDLKKFRDKCHVYTGTVGPISYDRQVMFDVKLYDDTGKVIGGCDHLLVAAKPFKKMAEGSLARFTGKIFKYVRLDRSIDYSVKVNKAKKLSPLFGVSTQNEGFFNVII